MFVDMADDQSGRGEDQDRDMPAQLVTIECGLMVNDVAARLLAAKRGGQGLGHQLRVVAAALDVLAQRCTCCSSTSRSTRTAWGMVGHAPILPGTGTVPV